MLDPAATIPIASLLRDGLNKNKAYFKFGGKWYEPFKLTAEQFLNPDYALTSDQVTAISGFNKWYKAGSEVVDLFPGGTYSITKINDFNSSFSLTLQSIDLGFGKSNSQSN